MSICVLCGEPMPADEEMFEYHGYSGPCPKPPSPPTPSDYLEELRKLARPDLRIVRIPGDELLTILESREAFRTRLVAAHKSVCTRDNCVLDGKDEHDEAFR